MDVRLTLQELIATRAPAAEAFLAALVQMPSDNPPGDCAAHGEMTAGLLERLGFTVERHVVPAALVQAQGMVSATNLVVRQRFGAGPVVALNAHGDVVAPGDGWSTDPYGAEVKNGWMYGRGAAVSKSDIATYAFALAALRDSGAVVNGTVELHITYDEETGGGLGPAWLLAEGISKPDMAIAAGFSYAVISGHNGCLHLEVTVSGKSAHAAKPDTGVDALEASTAILAALYAYRATLRERKSTWRGIDAPGLTIGLIEGGINTNVVPDKVLFRLDRRIVPDELLTIAEEDLRELIRNVGSRFAGISVTITRILAAEPLVPTAESLKLAQVLCKHTSVVFGEEITTTGAPLYTDARHYAAAGVPVVLYGAGPRSIEEANAHRADERLRLSDLHKATEVVALTLAEILA
jgi:succinyl-diaminopimelate desuccinylase